MTNIVKSLVKPNKTTDYMFLPVLNSRPLKSPFLRDIVLIQYLTDFM